LPLPTATGEGAGTTFNDKPFSGSFGTEKTTGVSLETTAGPCTTTGATTLAPPSTFDNKPSSGSFGAEGGPPSTVATTSVNVRTAGTADKFCPAWEALAAQEEARVDRVALCFMEGFEAEKGFLPRGISPLTKQQAYKL